MLVTSGKSYEVALDSVVRAVLTANSTPALFAKAAKHAAPAIFYRQPRAQSRVLRCTGALISRELRHE